MCLLARIVFSLKKLTQMFNIIPGVTRQTSTTGLIDFLERSSPVLRRHLGISESLLSSSVQLNVPGGQSTGPSLIIPQPGGPRPLSQVSAVHSSLPSEISAESAQSDDEIPDKPVEGTRGGTE